MAERLPRAVQKRALLSTQRARSRALDVRSDAQPVLRVSEIPERNEGGSAIGGVGSAFIQRRAGHARFTALEDLVCFDVTPFTVQIRSALYEVIGAARREQQKTRRYTRYEYDALAHPSKDSDGFGAKLAPH